jgi:hypothetical protein
LIAANWTNCRHADFDRESGYVQYRLRRKLLITAAMKEATDEGTGGRFRTAVSRLKVPKSTTAPIVPTTRNLTNRFPSDVQFKTTVLENRFPEKTQRAKFFFQYEKRFAIFAPLRVSDFDLHCFLAEC